MKTNLLGRAFAALLLMLLAFALVVSCESGDDDDNGNGGQVGTTASMTTRINTLRGTGNALTTVDTLTDIAQDQAEYNADRGTNNDSDESGDSIADRMRAAGYEFASVAYLFENRSEADTWTQWTGNAVYSSILTSDDYTDLGVGMAQATDGTPFWVVVVASEEQPGNATVAEMLEALNDFRTDNARVPFEINETLAAIAQEQAEANAQAGVDDADVLELQERVSETDYSFTTFMISTSNNPPQDAVNGWTDTTAEQGNMLREGLTDVGIGVAVGHNKQWWVVLYANPTDDDVS